MSEEKCPHGIVRGELAEVEDAPPPGNILEFVERYKETGEMPEPREPTNDERLMAIQEAEWERDHVWFCACCCRVLPETAIVGDICLECVPGSQWEPRTETVAKQRAEHVAWLAQQVIGPVDQN